MMNPITGKNQRIVDVINHLQKKYGANNIFIQDHWEADGNAIGLTDKTGKYLAYISTISNKDNNYYLSLENPSNDGTFPYSPAADFDNIRLTELENILINHLRLTH